MNAQTFCIARSGIKGALILGALLIAGLIFSLETLSWCLFILFVFWVFMFRNPERLATNLSNNAFLAPIDGKIKEIDTRGNRSKVVVDVGILDTGVLRSPIKILNCKKSAFHGVPLLMQKQAFFSPEYILSFGHCLIKVTQNLFDSYPFFEQTSFERGERMGFVKVGKVELEIENIELKINVGDKIKSGESVIGYLHEN